MSEFGNVRTEILVTLIKVLGPPCAVSCSFRLEVVGSSGEGCGGGCSYRQLPSAVHCVLTLDSKPPFLIPRMGITAVPTPEDLMRQYRQITKLRAWHTAGAQEMVASLFMSQLLSGVQEEIHDGPWLPGMLKCLSKAVCDRNSGAAVGSGALYVPGQSPNLHTVCGPQVSSGLLAASTQFGSLGPGLVRASQSQWGFLTPIFMVAMTRTNGDQFCLLPPAQPEHRLQGSLVLSLSLSVSMHPSSPRHLGLWV
jgi:hypothetical protein